MYINVESHIRLINNHLIHGELPAFTQVNTFNVQLLI